MTYGKGRWIVLLAALVAAGQAYGVINPKLQPLHLVGRYVHVVGCTVTAVDAKARTATLRLDGVAKGDFAAKTITLRAEGEEVADAILALSKGRKIVAYVGKTRRRHENDILFYVGSGVWYLGEMAGGQATWKVTSNADKGIDPSSSEIMFGTFNGKPTSLWEMMEDAAAGVAYYPAVPQSRFTRKVVADLGKPIRGVAIYDVDGDGRCDLLACSDAGNRLFVQDAKGQFVDRTEALGLAGTRSVSCSLADADGDGDADLLLDGTLYRQAGGKFAKTGDVPATRGCLSAAFVEYNGDGYPDVVASYADDGLKLYVNPGKAGGAFTDATEAAGLTEIDNGAGRTGYFEACDWDLDGRMDLLYAAGAGLLLWQNASGVFEPYDIADQEKDFSGGTAAFGTIVRPTTASVYLVAGDQKVLVGEDSGNLADETRAGNEIQDPVVGMLMAVAEDLNCDGTVDLYAASKGKGMSSFYVANRGYASFLLPEKYAGGKVVPPAVYNQPAWGLAAGDVNGDGAPELLVGGLDGKLSLLINQTLTDRPAKADISTINDVRKQIQTRIVTVRLAGGKAQPGTRLTLLDAKDKPVTHRWIGTNLGVGCSGPGQFTLAIREPGRYTLSVRLADGNTKKHAFTIDANTPRHQTVTIE